MTDEKYTFIEDLREKKITARSSRNKRTHTGKGGAIRLPSDNLTRKELQAMNSEVTYYRLNSPMKWAEFKAMPDDLKVSYVKSLREKFGATDKAIGEMLGVSMQHRIKVFKGLGLCQGKAAGGRHSRMKWNEEEFRKWAYGEAAEEAESAPRVTIEEQEIAPIAPIPVITETNAIAIEVTPTEFDSLVELLESGLFAAMHGEKNADTLNRICDLCGLYKKVKQAKEGGLNNE